MPTVYNKVTANGNAIIDLSQDTVTLASHIVAGFVGHLADGTQVTGTGGGGSSTFEYEEGTYTPIENIGDPSISFTNTHTKRPFVVLIFDSTQTQVAGNEIVLWLISDFYDWFSKYIRFTGFSYYTQGAYVYTASTGAANGSRFGTQSSSDTTYITSSRFTPKLPISSTTPKYIASRTYKWIAIWGPNT